MIRINSMVRKSLLFAMICVATPLILSGYRAYAQQISIRDNYFPLPVGLIAEFEPEDTTTEFFVGDGNSVFFDQGNAQIRVDEENTLLLAQPITASIPPAGKFTGTLFTTYTISPSNNAVEFVHSKDTLDLGSTGTVVLEKVPDNPVPILLTLTECPINITGRREDYVLTETTTGFGMFEEETFPWFSQISTEPVGTVQLDLMTFQDACLLKVFEPDEEITDPLILDIGWHLAKGYGIIQMEEEFDNGSQILKLISTNIESLWSSSLMVSILPPEAVNAGAQWKVIRDGTTEDSGFQTSGTQLDDLEQGLYHLEFSDIDGWNPPASRMISIKTQPVSITETYTRETGQVFVTIGPEDVISLGAQWRIRNDEFDSGFQASGIEIANVPVGEYNLEFQQVPQWVSPDNQMITIENGVSTTPPQFNYVRITGSITVTITPAEAVNAMAQWMILEVDSNFNSQFFNSGETLADVPTGTYILQAKDIDDWVALDQVIIVEENVTFEGSIHYAPDNDNDEMSDEWEINTLGSSDALPHIDEDGDGYSNLQEYRNQTHPMSYSIPLNQGWNLLSLSTIPPQNTVNEIFNGITIHPAVWTQNLNDLEQMSLITDALAGFWVFQKGNADSTEINQALQIDNTTSQYNLSLETGWNLVSINRVPEDNSVAGIFNGFSISDFVWKWEKNHFVQARNLDPLTGYWIYLNGASVKVPIEVTLQ